MATSPEISRKLDMLSGQTLAPTILFIGYGLVKLVTIGTSAIYWPDTYLPICGGLTSWVAVFGYNIILHTKRTRVSIFRLTAVYGAFIPMLYSIYAILYFGLYNIYLSIFSSFSIFGVAFGAISIAAGYRMAYGLQALTDHGRQDGTRPPVA